VRVLCPNEDKATGFWTTTAIPSKLFRGVIPRQPVGMMRRWLVVDAYSVFGLLFILETLLDFLLAGMEVLAPVHRAVQPFHLFRSVKSPGRKHDCNAHDGKIYA